MTPHPAAIPRDIAQEIDRLAGSGCVRFDQDMRVHTTMRVGGTAAAFVEVRDETALTALLRFLAASGVPHVVLGNGSNLIVADEGYGGVVLHIGEGLCAIGDEPDGFNVQSGATLAAIARRALDRGLTGLEFASGIPGSLGGAVAMNAGAYGREMKDVVLTTRCLDQTGEIVMLSGSEHNFGYRHSRIQDDDLVAVSVQLRLEPGDPAVIRDSMRDLARRRADKQPLHLPSAGSTFKRPVGYFSGQLIETCGLKGMRVGGAQVSEKHAGFIVNTGDATASDVVTLVRRVREKVFAETGVLLEPEVKLLGGDSLCSF